MQIQLSTNNNFEGKVKFDKRLSKEKISYVNRILDFSKDGKNSLRKRISKSSYDVEVFSMDTKKTIHPKVQFSSYFYKLKGKSFADAWDGKSTFSYQPLRIDKPINEGAEFLEKFLDKFEEYKSFYDYTYNGFVEKMKAFLKKINF